MNTKHSPDVEMITPLPEAEVIQAESLSPSGAARRRLGIGASGLILTLVSKPGMAGNPVTTYCGSKSGWHSASTTSLVQKDGGNCAGLSAGYWAHKGLYRWPTITTTHAAKTVNGRALPAPWFSDIYPEGSGSVYTDSSLYDVLVSNSNTFDMWNLRREFVVAYFNAAQGYNTHPSVLELKALWLEYAANKKIYIESTNTYMSGEELKFYLAASHH